MTTKLIYPPSATPDADLAADLYVSQFGVEASQNFGSAVDLLYRGNSGLGDERRVFFEFDWTDLGHLRATEGAAHEFHVWSMTSTQVAIVVRMQIFAYDERPFVESTMTWNNQLVPPGAPLFAVDYNAAAFATSPAERFVALTADQVNMLLGKWVLIRCVWQAALAVSGQVTMRSRESGTTAPYWLLELHHPVSADGGGASSGGAAADVLHQVSASGSAGSAGGAWAALSKVAFAGGSVTSGGAADAIVPLRMVRGVGSSASLGGTYGYRMLQADAVGSSGTTGGVVAYRLLAAAAGGASVSEAQTCPLILLYQAGAGGSGLADGDAMALLRLFARATADTRSAGAGLALLLLRASAGVELLADGGAEGRTATVYVVERMLRARYAAEVRLPAAVG